MVMFLVYFVVVVLVFVLVVFHCGKSQACTFGKSVRVEFALIG
jgi:hypothetical protein